MLFNNYPRWFFQYIMLALYVCLRVRFFTYNGWRLRYLKAKLSLAEFRAEVLSVASALMSARLERMARERVLRNIPTSSTKH